MYDAIVLGTGGVGSAALYHLARAGARVVGVDRFRPPHDHGSSHGETRVIRKSYFEHPDYVPLAVESYRLWNELSALTGRMLYHETGLVEIGPSDGHVVPGVLRAAEEHHLKVESLSPSEVATRWPGLRVPPNLSAVYEPAAGFLMVEDCVAGHTAAAAELGAELRTDCEVRGWHAAVDQVVVETTQGELRGKKLIVTAGAWAAPLLATVGLKLTVLRKSLFWMKAAGQARHLPTYLFELPTGIFYGFPSLDGNTVKVAEHSGGQAVANPLDVCREIDGEDREQIVKFVTAHLPAASADVCDHATCLYTMSADEKFIVDRHPEFENVVFAAGLSGHGFKFTAVLGRALSDMTLDGGTDLPVGFLSCAGRMI